MVAKCNIRGQYESGGKKYDDWLTLRLNESLMTISELSEKIGVKRQTISAYKKGLYKPTLTMIIAICWAFGMKDDPIEIYKLFVEDWN